MAVINFPGGSVPSIGKQPQKVLEPWQQVAMIQAMLISKLRSAVLELTSVVAAMLPSTLMSPPTEELVERISRVRETLELGKTQGAPTAELEGAKDADVADAPPTTEG